MELIKRDSVLWSYLTPEVRGLIETGETVLDFVHEHKDTMNISDYSFCVFSFAKAYEGFLKKLFLDMGFIKQHEYYGDDIRIGRLLSPYFMKEKENVFYRMCNHPRGSENLSHMLWSVWRNGRNLVFHCFPHNFRKLDYAEAFEIVSSIIDVMSLAVASCVRDQPEKVSSIIHS